MTLTASTMPTEAEYESYFESLSNWGRWGPDDRLGTLNLITPEIRARAAGLVSTGEVVSLARDMDPANPDPLGRGSVLQRYMQNHDPKEVAARAGMEEGAVARWSGVREYVGLIAHGSNTHLDGLGHMAWKGHSYNGCPTSAVTSWKGSTLLSIHQAAQGIFTRGVLLDIPATKDVPWLAPGEAVLPDDLEAAEERQGVRVEEGNVLLLYTGNFKRIDQEGLHRDHHNPGYGAGCLPWLHERGVALISSDNLNDVTPSGFASPDIRFPVHFVALVAMGLWLIDNMALDQLSEKCASEGRWDFMFLTLPWRLVGATSSPVSPVALF